MPTYVFSCKKCNHEFQVKTSWREKDGVRCPECNGADLRELLGSYSVHVGTPSTANVPERCRGCDNQGAGCPMAH